MPNTIKNPPRSLVITYNQEKAKETKKRIRKCLSHVMDNVPDDAIEKIEDLYQLIIFVGDIDPQYRKNKKNNIVTRRKVRSIKKRFCLSVKDFLKELGITGQWTREDRKGGSEYHNREFVDYTNR